MHTYRKCLKSVVSSYMLLAAYCRKHYSSFQTLLTDWWIQVLFWDLNSDWLIRHRCWLVIGPAGQNGWLSVSTASKPVHLKPISAHQDNLNVNISYCAMCICSRSSVNFFFINALLLKNGQDFLEIMYAKTKISKETNYKGKKCRNYLSKQIFDFQYCCRNFCILKLC